MLGNHAINAICFVGTQCLYGQNYLISAHMYIIRIPSVTRNIT